MAVRRDVLKAISVIALSSTSPVVVHAGVSQQYKNVRPPEQIADDLNESLSCRYGGEWEFSFDSLGEFVLFKRIS